MINKYGWLDKKRGSHQSDGVFIDDKNRILYWPAKKSVGYILDEASAHKHLKSIDLKRYYLDVTIILISLSVLFAYGIINPVKDQFVTYDSALVILIGLIFARLLSENTINSRNRLKIAGVPVEKFEPIYIERPKANVLKPSILSGRFKFYLWTLGSVLVCALTLSMFVTWLFAWWIVSLEPSLIYFISGVLFLLFFKSLVQRIWNEIRGIRQEDIPFFYQPISVQILNENTEKNSFVRHISHYLRNEYLGLVASWKLWAGVGILLMVLLNVDAAGP